MRFVVLEQIIEQLIDGDFLDSRAKEISPAHGFHASFEKIFSILFLMASARFANVFAVRSGIAYPEVPASWHAEYRTCTTRTLAHGVSPLLAVSKTPKRSGPWPWPSVPTCDTRLPTFSVPLAS